MNDDAGLRGRFEPSLTDSAGQPWAGRSFGGSTPFAGDDGSAPAEWLDAVARFRAGEATQTDVVDVFRGIRLLIPLVAQLGEQGVGEHGLTVDKSADLSIVTVAGPDGRAVLPVFSSVEAMSRWNADARPVPADAVRVALAAADEGTELVVVDATAESEFVLRRPAVWAVAQSLPWSPAVSDPQVAAVMQQSVASEPDVAGLTLVEGDSGSRLRGPELVVRLQLHPGLDRAALESLVARLQERWSHEAVIAERVDSLAVSVVAAE